MIESYEDFMERVKDAVDEKRLQQIEQRLAALEAKVDALYNATTLQQRKGRNDT